MADSFGLKIGFEGEKEFKKALADINQSFKVLGSKMKLATSQFDKNDKSVEALAARNKVLRKEIDEQITKIDTLRKALQNAATSFGENDRRTQNWQIQLNKVGSFTVTFNCKHFKYSLAGQKTVSADASELTINNSTAFESRPYMKIYGSGLIRLMVQPEGEGTSLWTISEVDETIEIDSELMNCFKDTTLKNDTVTGDGFPMLKSGTTTIACVGNVQRIEVIPRCCCL